VTERTAEPVRRAAAAARVACILWTASLALAQTPGYLALSGVRVWSLGEASRVAIELSGETHFRHETLQNPSRVFIDIENSRPARGQPLHRTIPVGDGLVDRIRVSQTQPAVMRVVLDLTGSVDYSISQLTNPYRVLIEVKRKLDASKSPLLASIEREVEAGQPPATSRSEPAPQRVFRVPERYFNPPRPETPLIASYAPPPLISTALPWPGTAIEGAFRVASPSRPPAVVRRAAAPKPVPAKPAPATVAAAKPAQRTSAGARSLTRALGLKLRRVVLDAGHGGHDTGTIGRSGLMEKDLVLDITLRLGRLIEERLGADVIYTREADIFIPLEQRTQIANDHLADLFLSIHANSSPAQTVAGVETYYLSLTASQAELAVAARENATSTKSVHELNDLVRQIAMNEKVAESREFAAKVQASAHALAAQLHGKTLPNRGVKKAPFVVLIGAQMPSILAEVGFLSNAREEAALRRDDHRQKIAEALYRGVARYGESLSHYRVAQAGGSSNGQED
jgi:N-acetylmuramoyl-L-alanine amidase